MSEPFEIDLGIDNLLPATAAFRTIGEQLDALADRFDALVDKISAITSQATAAAAALKSTGTTRSSSSSGGSGGGDGASGNGGSGQKDPKLLIAEYQQLMRAEENFLQASYHGTQEQLRDAELLLGRRQAAVDKLTEMSAPDAVKLPGGPHQNLAKAQADMAAAIAGGDADQVSDAVLKLKKAQEDLDKIYSESHRFGGGPHQNLAKERENLRAAQASGNATELADAELRVRRAEEALVRATGAEKPFSVRSGPHQKLLDIQEQMGKLDQISDPVRREAARKDLDREMSFAHRAINLHEQKQQDPNSLLVPGLLSNFQTLNRLMTRVMDGNVIGAAFSIGTLLRQHAAGGASVGEILSGKFRQGANGGYMWGGAGTTSGATGKMGAATGSLSDFILPGVVAGATASPESGGVFSGIAAKLLPLLTNPITIAAAAIAVAVLASAFVLKKLYDAADAAAQAIRSLANAAIVTGGTYGETAGLQAMGLSPDQITGVAQQLRQTITAGGSSFAMMAAGQSGIGVQGPQELGIATDSAKILRDMIRYIGGMNDADQRHLQTIRLNLQAVEAQIESYHRIGPLMEADAALRLKYTAAYSDSAQAFGDQQMRLKTNWDTLTQAFASPVIGVFAAHMKDWNTILTDVVPLVSKLGELFAVWADAMLSVATFVAKVITGLVMLTDTVSSFIAKWTGLEWIFKKIEKVLGITGDKHDAAADKNVKAAGDFATAVGEFTRGVTGGGERAKGSIPSALQGMALQKVITGNSLRAGAFSI